MSETQKKTFAVLTSGGDAPGMNAAVRSVVRTALHKGHTIYGIFHGYEGLMQNRMDELQERSVSNIINRGGTILYTARSKEFTTEEGQKKAVEILRSRGIDGLVVIGGDGSFRGAQKLSALGIPTIGLPGTIDNDIASTEYTIGFDTALNTAVQSIDKLRDTSQSHDRCSVVEVMGRNAGHLALYAGLATGAIATLIPERPFNLDCDVVDRMKATMTTGKRLGHPVRSLKNPFSRAYLKAEYSGISDEELEAMGTGSLYRAAVEGDEKTGSFLAGQIAAIVNKEQPAAEIIREIFEEAETVLNGAKKWVK